MNFEPEDCPFPQLLGTWEGALKSAFALVDRLCDEAIGGRFRVGLCTVDPQSFCAMFVALARREIDIFLFNPSWGTSDFRAAEKVASPQWIVGNWVKGSFELTKGSEPEQGKNAEVLGLRVMIPTGGTSGRIRFAIHNRSTLLASVQAFQKFFGIERVSSHCVLPLYHVSGFMQVVRAIATRGEVVFGSIVDFEKNHSLLAATVEECRFLSLVPTQLQRLLESEVDLDLVNSYRAIFVGGGPASKELLEMGRERHLRLAPTYGMTETASMVATLLPESFSRGESGQGLPLPHAEIEIVSEDVNGCSPGNIGRIKLKTASLFAGYYGESERIGDEYLTNDLGEIGPNGELTVHGRLDRVIISGGENINLSEIEEVLLDTGLVIEAAAFGIEDSEWGSRLCVAYVPEGKIMNEAALQQKVGERLNGVKRPKSWLPMSALPRSEAGKVNFKALKERLEKDQ